jgi:hypothetical protein
MTRARGERRNIRITPKGLRIRAAIDRGEYKTLSTLEARRLAAKRNRPGRRA